MTTLAPAPKLPNHNTDTLGATLESLLGWAQNIEKLVLPLVAQLNPEIASLIGEGTQFAEDVAGAVVSPPPPPTPVAPAAAVPAGNVQGASNTPVMPSWLPSLKLAPKAG